MADAEGQAQGERSAARIARDAAVHQAAGTLAYIAICALVSLAILKRDALGRAWRRATSRPAPAGQAAEAAAMAEVRRDISRLEHMGEARPGRARGLYEWPFP